MHSSGPVFLTCVCPTLAAAVTACWTASCCRTGSDWTSGPQSWTSRVLMISAWPFSAAWTSAHCPLLSAWPTCHTERGTHEDSTTPILNGAGKNPDPDQPRIDPETGRSLKQSVQSSLQVKIRETRTKTWFIC